MQYQIVLGDDGRVIASSSDSLLAGAMAADMPQDFSGATQHDWRYDGGQWIYAPLPQA